MPKIWHYINKPVCTKTRTDLIKKDRPDDSQRSAKAKKTEQRRRLLLLNVPSSQSSGRRRSDCKSQNHRRSFKWETSRSIWRQIRRRLTKRRPKRRNRKRRINREPTTKISRSQLCVCLHSARRSTTADVQQHASKSIENLWTKNPNSSQSDPTGHRMQQFVRFSTVPVPAAQHCGSAWNAKLFQHGNKFPIDSRTCRAVRPVAFPATIKSAQCFHFVGIPGSDRIQ